MVKCERASLVLFITYLQNRIENECRDAKDVLRCVLRVLESVKVKLEELSIEDIEREIFSY